VLFIKVLKKKKETKIKNTAHSPFLVVVSLSWASVEVMLKCAEGTKESFDEVQDSKRSFDKLSIWFP
jgi:hypothetical protein